MSEAYNEPVAFTTRGACPGLHRPMQTGDGLLARLRPSAGMNLAALDALADASGKFGNGILEITARGSLQLRGLRDDNLPAFVAAVEASGLVAFDGPAIEVSPLSGLDTAAPGNGRALEAALRQRCAALLSSPRIAPKLSITIDDGSLFGMSGIKADIRITCLRPEIWRLSLVQEGGDLALQEGSEAEMLVATARLLALLIEAGDRLRAGALSLALIEQAFPTRPTAPVNPRSGARCGVTLIDETKALLCLRPRLGQWRAEDLSAFIAAAQGLGLRKTHPFRLAAGRLLILPDLSPDIARRLATKAQQFGLSADETDPSAAIIACPGKGACASGHFATRDMAERLLARARPLLDGSLVLHLSGCRKGCAHSTAALCLVGVKDGLELVVSGRPGDPSDQDIAGGGGDFAIEKLARLVEAERHAGESAAACLSRLKADGVMGAPRQE